MKKNVIIVILLCMIFAVGGYIIGTDSDMIFGNTSGGNNANENKKEENKEEEPKKEEKKEEKPKKEIDPNKLLEKIVGDWGRCEKEYECYGILIGKENGAFTYLSYMMWSEAGGSAPIKVTNITDEDNFEIKMHFDAYEDATIAYEAHDVELKINTSKLKNNILIVSGKEYKKVVGDADTFYRSVY